MLSYLHGFHAGNHADVLKHGVLTLLFEALMTKPKPLVYVESHAGAGVYDLDGEQAGKTGESADGIARLWPRRDEFPELSGYFEAISDLNPNGGLARYPGSPWIARHALRADDRLILMELHKAEVATLRAQLNADPRIHIHYRDGFEGLAALLPPKPPRGLVLIDPPYEVKTDYAQVASCLEVAHARWPTGVYAIWYPRLAVQRDQAELLLKRLSRIAPRLLVAELVVRPQSDEFGMYGSGLALVNPPWQFEERLGQWLPRLASLLAIDGFGMESKGRGPTGWRLEWRAGGAKGP
ncbi:23S rRNA (adenine(2030)-N(6))-methyltransferase RlmJ [Thiocystis violacea]|uniref:23S rRNA (adenine(2030)-N(6))-methyltransferase RlmJ n=1 Tax=Thiocystis violacea TaxID=13725 RepID=UPI001905449A|nr:23S rRNA (adenine(2030)-N(6))-methyltransferase RlmJ [Thiocystis violacea]MBK1718556.1 23S rRNA (adenine(2030)-N(6))-methyltransferase RlmJ [Thiocystis violacea]